MSEIIGHHRICRIRGGSDDPSNIMRVDRREEQKMHNHQGIRLFHEKLIALIDEWHTTDVIKEARERIRGIVYELGPDMYNPRAVRDWKSIDDSFKKRNGILVPNRFSMEPQNHTYSSHD